MFKNKNFLKPIKQNIDSNIKNINNEKKELVNNNDMNNSNNNSNNAFNTRSYNNYLVNNNSNIIDNNIPNIKMNKNTNLKFQKINKKQIINNKELIYNNKKGNQLYPQITPKKTNQKKIFDIHLNDRFNYSINNYENENNGLEHNNYTNNQTMINREIKPQNDLSKKIILTEECNNYNGKNIIKKTIKPNSQKPIINSINKEENGNGNKKFNKIINSNNNNNSNNNTKFIR